MNDVLDEAYLRLHGKGPEWGGENYLSNHGPMAVEVLARRGHADRVPRWLDDYLNRLDDLPRPSDAISEQNWREALGERSRLADWTEFMTHQVAEAPWRDVLGTWWPRLLPGIAAGATHGVIRVGHAVRTLLGGDESAAALGELAHALGYWAGRSQTVPGVQIPAGELDAARALESVPRIPEQNGPIRLRLGQLGDMPDWPGSLAALRAVRTPDEAPLRLSELVTAATLRYRTHGHASPILLVHTATAPNAVLHVLPALAAEHWVPSAAAVWAASAAITAAYGPAAPADEPDLPAIPDDPSPDAVTELLDSAAGHGDEHVIKFSDTASEVYQRTGDATALAAAARVIQLIDADG